MASLTPSPRQSELQAAEGGRFDPEAAAHGGGRQGRQDCVGSPRFLLGERLHNQIGIKQIGDLYQRSLLQLLMEVGEIGGYCSLRVEAGNELSAHLHPGLARPVSPKDVDKLEVQGLR